MTQIFNNGPIRKIRLFGKAFLTLFAYESEFAGIFFRRKIWRSHMTSFGKCINDLRRILARGRKS